MERLVREVRHIEQCAECRQQWQEIVRYRRGREPDYQKASGQGRGSTASPVAAAGPATRPTARHTSDHTSDHNSELIDYDWLADEHLMPEDLAWYVARSRATSQSALAGLKRPEPAAGSSGQEGHTPWQSLSSAGP
ncbi:MAG: hypothetical protein EBU88_11335, partial [Acidobacteria bacterium]|nr:hypothetical protein [Acidobacteriota bacterium]